MTIRSIFTRIRNVVLGPPMTHEQQRARQLSHQQQQLRVQHEAANHVRHTGFLP